MVIEAWIITVLWLVPGRPLEKEIREYNTDVECGLGYAELEHLRRAAGEDPATVHVQSVSSCELVQPGP